MDLCTFASLEIKRVQEKETKEMTRPHIQTVLQDLLCRAPGFALYRLPWADACHLVLQTSGTVERLACRCEAVERPGFVMAPFHPGEEHPPVRIRPDVTAHGWDEMERALAALDTSAWPSAAPDAPTVLPAPEGEASERARYEAAFARFIAPLREGRFGKLVLSRCSVMEAPAGFSPLDTFVRACEAYPRMLIYLCHTPLTGTWMGCTPEILLSGRADRWHTVALAGTQPLQAGEKLPDTWDAKNREEQAFVADYIRSTVRRLGCDVQEEGPYTARAGQVAHLKTDFRFRLRAGIPSKAVLQALHPTPAVCGLPKEEALRFILAHEGYDRSYYSGFVGRTDGAGQTDLYVNLRCMQTDGCRIRLYAGGGILPSSDAATEWEETQEKMATLKRVICLPQPGHPA